MDNIDNHWKGEVRERLLLSVLNTSRIIIVVGITKEKGRKNKSLALNVVIGSYLCMCVYVCT